jgi:hypothetical protein
MSEPKYAAAVARMLEDEVATAEADNHMASKVYKRPMMIKRNSELLNSLLGLPKNILKSGR